MSAIKMIRWPQVVLFGDSLTQRCFSEETPWGSMLAERLQRKADIINRGLSGWNVAWNKKVLPRLYNADNSGDIAAFVIFLGANCSNTEINPRQHVPLVEYKAGLIDMVQYLQSIGVSRDKVIMISPPMVDLGPWIKKMESEGRVNAKSQEVTEQYAKACIEAATEAGTKSVDFFALMKKRENWQELLSDGLHLSTDGAVFLENSLWPVLDKVTSHLPMILPEWKDVDYENLDSLLEA